MPAAFDGALFFSDYSRDTIWVMYRGVNGLPDPTNIRAFVRPAANPVQSGDWSRRQLVLYRF